jgi:6-phosphogluconate dehydrogenase
MAFLHGRVAVVAELFGGRGAQLVGLVEVEQVAGLLDCGTSGGVWGLDRGYSLMIGGDPDAVAQVEPIFASLSPGVGSAERTPGREGEPSTAEKGYLHCGPSGAGHFVKMVHNGIEYGRMASIAEGLNILHKADIGMGTDTGGPGGDTPQGDAETAPLADPQYYRYEIDLAEVAEVWRRGSVIGSCLVDLSATALHASPGLDGFAGQVSDSGEGRWTAKAAIDEGVPAPVLTAALYSRFGSRHLDEFADRALSAMRKEFGGHDEKPAR